jgi:hypothetical protein
VLRPQWMPMNPEQKKISSTPRRAAKERAAAVAAEPTKGRAAAV